MAANRCRSLQNGGELTAYETLPFGAIPELFWITNWRGDYSVLPNPVSQRQTVVAVDQRRSKLVKLPTGAQPNQEQRLRVRDFIDQHTLLRYNQGDPLLFNQQADAILNSAEVLRVRGALIPNRIDYAGRLALMPVEAVCNTQRWLSRRGTRAVGGKPHNLIITPQGQFSSHTGLRLIPGT